MVIVMRGQRGFTYIGLLIFVAVLGVGLAATGLLWETAQRREKERELLFVGEQFRRAIGAYYEGTPGGLKQYPRDLEVLLQDKRYPGIQRYLRRIYADPMTGKQEWGLVDIPGQGIMGVYSKSEQAPIKAANFAAQQRGFDTAKKYSDWKFVYTPGQALGRNLPSPPLASWHPKR